MRAIRARCLIAFALGALLQPGCAPARSGPAAGGAYDVLIRRATLYDGSGSAPRVGDLAIEGDRIAALGELGGARGEVEIDARGLAVAPGFINMLSWANESLIQDGRGLSDIHQGVTLEIFGEGTSMGPLTPEMKRRMVAEQGDIKFAVEWTTLGEYLEHLVRRGVSPNVASFVGATTVRIHELGYADRAPMPAELGRMQALVRQAMEEGALGVGSSLIYAAAFYAKTDELIALASASRPYGGVYITHMRSEGSRLLEAIDEVLTISRAAGERVAREMRTPTDEWENFFTAVESPEQILLVAFRNDSLKPLTGKSLAEIARLRGKSPEETAMDLVVEDGSEVGTVYFLMSEENVRRQVAIPWVSFGSDAEAAAPEGIFLRSNPHPRAYGNFARLLGRYVRDERIIPLEEAIRRMTSLPAANLGLDRRGALRVGHYADLAIFDPARIRDNATYAEPHQLAEGMVHVFVNGTQVLRDGRHTGALPGRVVRGAGWRGGTPR